MVFTGDIAFSGEASQYKLAQDFFNDVKREIVEEYQIPVSFITTPGNHDCNFENNSSVRDIVIESLSNGSISKIDNDILDKCLAVQEEYFEFRKIFASDQLIEKNKLWSQYRFVVNGKTIIFDCLNVAWCSQLKEAQGNLLFPYQLFSEQQHVDSDFRIVALHHPFHWLSQDQYRNVRTNVQLFGVVVLTGHEHNSDASIVDGSISGETLIIEAGALQISGDLQDSIFNVIEVDLEESQFRRDVFSFDGLDYQISEQSPAWSTFRSLPKRIAADLEVSVETCAWLNDSGANYAHPSKSELMLGDIFIYPDLKIIGSDEASESEKEIVSSERLCDASNIEVGTVITGNEQSGKTALLRMLFLDFRDKSYVPIYVDLKEVSRVSDRDLSAKYKKAAEKQYGDIGGAKWEKLSKRRKILFLDDFDSSKVADRFRWKVIAHARKNFEKVIITASELFGMNELISPDMSEQLDGFAHYELQNFGHQLRYKLIHKWRSIGNDYSLSTGELIERVDKAEKTLNLVLGKNLVPRVPIYLLTLLQSLESSNPLEIKNSAYGHYYQYLITEALSAISVDPGELDEFFNYCAQLAWLFYQSDNKELEFIEIQQFNQVYSDEYTSVDVTARLAQLTSARLIGNGRATTL